MGKLDVRRWKGDEEGRQWEREKGKGPITFLETRLTEVLFNESMSQDGGKYHGEYRGGAMYTCEIRHKNQQLSDIYLGRGYRSRLNDSKSLEKPKLRANLTPDA